MYTMSKRLEISAAHNLKLNYPSKCAGVHGHNWIITVHCRAEDLDENGMIVDFAKVKKQLTDLLDHQYLNDVLGFNPTAENMAQFIVSIVPKCYKVEVQESEGNIACYEI